ncbi:hypothetical protein EMIT0P43_30249 [Pseudomonas jessenii]
MDKKQKISHTMTQHLLTKYETRLLAAL